MFICAFLVLTLSPPTPRSAPPPPTSEVTVSERVIELPHLPESVAQAHKEFGPLSINLTESLKDLDRTLRKLYACPEASIPLQKSFQVPRSQADELRFLVSLVKDDRYAILEEPVFQAWKEWQIVLMENDLAQSTTATTPLPSSKELEKKDLQRHVKAMRKSARYLNSDFENLVDMFTIPDFGGKGKIDMKKVITMWNARLENEDRIITTRATAATANRHAPSLSKAWSPLAECLNADALKLANLDVSKMPFADAVLQALRVQAKIHFLERFRSALWFSSVVWADMTSHALPTPLQNLNPPPVNTAAGAGHP